MIKKTGIGALLAVSLIAQPAAGLFGAEQVYAASSSEEKDYTITDATWSDDFGRAMAEWEKPESATRYHVQLYRTSTKYPVGKAVTTGTASHDFSSAISQKGTGNYFYEVYPIKGGESMTVTSDIFEVDSDTMSEIRAYLKDKKASTSTTNAGAGPTNPNGIGTVAEARWVMNPTGTWKYLKSDGTYAKNEWLESEGKWYYFGSNSLMATGWQKVRNYWYYLGEDGACWMNTVTPDGYTVNESGVWIDPATGSPASSASAGSSSPVATDLETVKLGLRESSAEPGAIRKVEIGSASNVRINEVSFSEPYEDWTIGKTVTVTISVTAANSARFTSKTKYSLGTASFLGSEGDEQNRTLRFSYHPRMTLKTPDGLYVTSDGVLKWNKIPNASQYRVVITYTDDEEDKKSTKTHTVTKAELAIDDYVESYDEVSIKITAQANKTNRTYVLDSAAATISDLQAFIDEYTLDGSFRTSGGNLSYKDESGEKLKGWQQLAGSWYFFDKNGNAVGPGWYQDTEGGGLWYYFDTEHHMVTGRITDDGKEYFLNDGSNASLPYGAWVE